MQQAMNQLSFDNVKKMIIEELENYKKFGPVRVFRLATDLLKDENKAEKFMLSKHGGYSMADMNYVRYQINRRNV
jgi:hypothetical protein